MYGDGPIAATAIAASTVDATVVKSQQFPAIALKVVVIDLGEKAKDGHRVVAVKAPWFELVRMFLRDPNSLYQIDWRKLEEIIAGAWERTGFFDEVLLTPRSRDKGRDVIATKKGVISIRIFDQAKAYNPGHLVTEEEVRAMVGVLNLEGNVSKGYITTTSHFAPGVWKDAQIKRLLPYQLELRDCDKLLPWLNEVADQ